jgi:DNA polymerase-1
MTREFEFDYQIITKESDVPKALKELGSVPEYGIDCETTGLDPRQDEIVGISIANQDTAFYFTQDALVPFASKLRVKAQDPNHLFVFHNAVFDLHFISQLGVEFVNVADTMIASFMVDENRSQALKPLSEHYLNISLELPTFKDMQKELYQELRDKYKEDLKEYRKKNPAKGTPLFGMEDNPPEMKFSSHKEITALDMDPQKFGRYAALDARLTYDFWQKMKYYLKEEQVEDVFWNIEMPFIFVLYQMEKSGLGIDKEQLYVLEKKYLQEMKTCEEKLQGMAGEDFNPNSTQQLAEYLYEQRGFKTTLTTNSGAPSTNVLALQRLEPEDDSGFVTAVLDYRKYSKLLSTYIQPFIELVEIQDTDEPRIYGNYNQTGTVTGRLSSSSPNLQNIPSHGETGDDIRKLFVAKNGYMIVNCDYSQLELRILAHYSQDENYIKLFREGGDPHQQTADLVGVERSIGKTLNFAWAYGAGPRKLCDTIESSGYPRPNQNEAREWIDGFEQARPALVQWKNDVIRWAKKLGYVRTIAKRRRHLQGIKSYDGATRGRAERQAVNSIIQGSAADIINYASVVLYDLFKEKNFDARIIGQVHDELLIEVKENQAEKVAELTKNIMEKTGEVFEMRVPLEADPGIAKSWYGAH